MRLDLGWLNGELRRFATDRTGSTAIEYVLLGGVVGIGIIGALQGLASGTDGVWGETILPRIENAITGAASGE